jgi:hypothetical protein
MSDETFADGRLIRSLWNRLLGKSHNGRRDRYETFGWNKALRAEDFVGLYHRNGVASRIIRAFPRETWSEAPAVYDESEDGAENSESLTGAWQRLNRELGICHYMERADRLSAIGQYGLLYMGFNDSANLSDPIEGQADLLYLSAYGEHSVSVSQWDMNERSPRFGMPELYTLMTGRSALATKSATRSITVHHSRVLHLSEFLDDDEVYGVPRLMPSYNYLQDLEKVAGSGAETFWLCANRGVLWSADSNAEFDDDDMKRLKEQSDEYEHQLRRSIAGTGLSATVLGSDTPDPSGNLDSLLKLIAGTHGVPLRILTGSEAGELASSQDATNWAAQIDDRRSGYAAPKIVRPFIEKMIATGNLPEPEGTINVEWDALASLSEKEKADIGKTRSESLAAYVGADGADYVMPLREFRYEILGLPEESEYEEDEEGPDDEDDEDVQAGFGNPPASGEGEGEDV